MRKYQGATQRIGPGQCGRNTELTAGAGGGIYSQIGFNTPMGCATVASAITTKER